jgi:hypothetical protein
MPANLIIGGMLVPWHGPQLAGSRPCASVLHLPRSGQHGANWVALGTAAVQLLDFGLHGRLGIRFGIPKSRDHQLFQPPGVLRCDQA